MPVVYCPHCYAVNSDRRGACRKCRRLIPGMGTHKALGILLLAPVVGVVVTAVYAFLMFCGWNRWKLIFGVTDPEMEITEHYADEAAFLLGVGVFVVATALAANWLFGSGRRRSKSPADTNPNPPL